MKGVSCDDCISIHWSVCIYESSCLWRRRIIVYQLHKPKHFLAKSILRTQIIKARLIRHLQRLSNKVVFQYIQLCQGSIVAPHMKIVLSVNTFRFTQMIFYMLRFTLSTYDSCVKFCVSWIEALQ